MQVDVESIVGFNVFVWIVLVFYIVVDLIIVYSQFDVFIVNIGGWLFFFIFDKYVVELDKYFLYKFF